MSKPWIVGISGQIGSGKTTATDYLQKKGIPTIRCDEISRILTQPDTDAYRAIVNFFGPNCLKADQTLNRKYLRHEIFNTAAKKQWLETLLHPLIHKYITAWHQQQAPAPFHIIDIPLLTEKTYREYQLNYLCLITCSDTLQTQRIQKRDRCSTSLINKMISAQIPINTLKRMADITITNNSSLQDFEQQLEALYQHLCALA